MSSLVLRSSNAALVAARAVEVTPTPVPGKKTTDAGGGLIPPERPPKKPHLRAPLPLPPSASTSASASSSRSASSSGSSSPSSAGHISADHEMRRIEASAHELMNLQPQAGPQAPPPPPPVGHRLRKPPAPDPPVSPPRLVKSMPASPAKSPVPSVSPPRFSFVLRNASLDQHYSSPNGGSIQCQIEPYSKKVATS